MKTFLATSLGTIVMAFALSACDNSSQPATPGAAALQETTTDLLGLHRTSINYRPMIEAGARVVNVPERGTFFLVWTPPDYAQQKSKRVMVAVHGSRGTAYAEAQDELSMAQKYGYAIVGLQWWLGSGERYLTPKEVYELAELALQYMQSQYGSDRRKVAFEGLSRGAAISYEVTWEDRRNGTNYFALTISHSGGIPSENPPPFIQRLLAGEYGAAPFTGAHFFMYCGMQDEEWGAEMCRQMHHAENLMQQYGAVIEGFIEDANGKHRGYHLKAQYHEAGVQTFIRLTPD